jgi:hypothetical protein
MAKTASQRQAAYRARRPHAGRDGNGERRLSVWIETGAFLALARLARRYGVTRQTLIEQMVIAEDERILADMEPDSAQWCAYFATRRYAVTMTIRYVKQEKPWPTHNRASVTLSRNTQQLTAVDGLVHHRDDLRARIDTSGSENVVAKSGKKPHS